jgi:hypothetical protein
VCQGELDRGDRVVAALAQQAHTAGHEPADAARSLPLPPPAAAVALVRAYRQLDGVPPYDPPEAIAATLDLSP